MCRCIFPTPVGVNRVLNLYNELESDFPHARGGEPGIRWLCSPTALHFPHARGGEPWRFYTRTGRPNIFPTHVGVNRLR